MRSCLECQEFMEEAEEVSKYYQNAQKYEQFKKEQYFDNLPSLHLGKKHSSKNKLNRIQSHSFKTKRSLRNPRKNVYNESSGINFKEFSKVQTDPYQLNLYSQPKFESLPIESPKKLQKVISFSYLKPVQTQNPPTIRCLEKNLKVGLQQPLRSGLQISKTSLKDIEPNPEIISLKKSQSDGSLISQAKYSLKSLSQSQNMYSQSGQLSIKQISFRQNQNKEQLSESRKVETPSTDFHLSSQNTNIFNFAKQNKVSLYKSAINLEEFRCVRAESIGAESQSSQHYSEVIFRTSALNQRCSSKRTSNACKSKSRSKNLSKITLNNIPFEKPFEKIDSTLKNYEMRSQC